MSRTFAGKLTIPAATPTNLLTLLVAAGFASTAMAQSAQIQNGAATLYKGSASNVSNTNGFPIAASALYGIPPAQGRGIIDLTQIWLYSVAGTDVFIDVAGR